ncbi:MAG: DEAD/DEAH box helicase [Candidatus Diapherotrites archaeon]|nr:DEAD/DEAH box helicase [Candidatus Diapherotrites archaeon]
MAGTIKHPLIRSGSIKSRLYQEILTARIIDKGSSLVVAPTALGKTVIAAMVSAAVLKKNPKSKVLFLAPTKPLAVQHHRSMKAFINLKEDSFSLMTGALKPEERSDLWRKSTVICATPQTIENELVSSNIDLSDVSLLIFDEAHRAVKNYAYVFISKQYQRQGKNQLVLALTASPGASVEKINDVCSNLNINNIEIKTSGDSDVKEYVKELEIDWVKVDLPQEFTDIKKLLENVCSQRLNELKKMEFIESADIKNLTKKNLLDLGSKIRTIMLEKRDPLSFAAISLQASLMKLTYAIELLETQGIHSLSKYFNSINEKKIKSKAEKRLLSDMQITKARVLCEKLKNKGIDHPKLPKLLETLKLLLSKNPKAKFIVFSNYRNTASRIVNEINGIKGISAERFIGQAMKTNDKGLSQKKQHEMLERFRKGKFNVLVATSVAEEGLDIPAVDAVILYEPVPSEIRFIQRRGRTGRSQKGKVFIFMAKKTRDESFYWSSISKERKMIRTLNSMSKVFNGKNTSLFEQKSESKPTEDRHQKSILEFSRENNKGETDLKQTQAIIIVDHREKASRVMRHLAELDIAVKAKQLPVADYILSDRVAVERKAADDFLQSLLDGRLFSQVKELRRNFEKPVLIVEGSNIYSLRNISPKAISGAIASIIVDYSMPVVSTQNPAETAMILAAMAKREQFDEKRPVRLQGEKTAMTAAQQQQFIVESLPGIGPVMACELLKKFGSVEAVFSASDEELKKTENLGEKKAQAIRDILTRKFEEDKINN